MTITPGEDLRLFDADPYREAAEMLDEQSGDAPLFNVEEVDRRGQLVLTAPGRRRPRPGEQT